MIEGPIHHPSRILRVLQTANEPLATKDIADRLMNFYPKEWEKYHKRRSHIFDAIESLRSAIGAAIKAGKVGYDVVTIEEKRPRRHYIPA